MSPEKKNTIVGLITATIVVGVIVGIVVLVVLYKRGKFDQYINNWKVNAAGNLIKKIRFERSDIMDIRGGTFYDENGATISYATFGWKCTASSMWGGAAPDGWLADSATNWCVTQGGPQWIECVATTPQTVKRFTYTGSNNQMWRLVGLKTTMWNMNGKVAWTYTSQTQDPVDQTIPIVKSYSFK